MGTEAGDGRTERPSTQIPSSTGPSPYKAPAAPEPLTDTGWSWVVMAGGLLSNFTAIGFLASMSVYLTVWMEDFDASATTVGLVMSVGSIMRGILSTFSGAICTRFGARRMLALGGGLTAAGILLCAFAPTIEVVIFSNGLIIALGANLSFVSAFQALGMYFSKRFTFANGISTAGISLGQLVLPPLYTYLIDAYGWRGSMFITAGMSMHILISAALMRPNNRMTRAGHAQRENGAVDKSVAMATVNDRNENPDRIESKGVVQLAKKVAVEGSDFKGATATALSDAGRTANSTERNSTAIKSVGVDGVGVESTIRDDGVDVVSLQEPVLGESQSALSCFSQFKHFMLDTYGLRRLVRNPRFIVMIGETFCHGVGNLAVAYLVPRAVSVGVEPEAASFLLSMVGVCGLLGRISPGWFIDRDYVTAEMAFALAMIAYASSVALTPLFVSLPPLAVLSVLIGLASGVCSNLFLVIVRSVVRPSDTLGAVGVQLFIWGVGSALGLFLAGKIYDITQSYDFAFYTSGAFLLASSALMLVMYTIHRTADRQRSPALYAVPSEEPTKENHLDSAERVVAEKRS